MTQFKITAMPAMKTDGGVQVVLRIIGKTVVDCAMNDLPAELAKFAATMELPYGMLGVNAIHVDAGPIGRAPNGYKAFEAANKNRYVHTVAATEESC